jgi:exonuclease SbcC
MFLIQITETMTIRSIHIGNFQSHKKSELDFHEGVNVIVGSSDSGKSAILRALRWVLQNRPTGESFRSNWGGQTDVTLVIDKGMEVVRLRNDTTNGYRLGTSGFDAIKTEVPQEIQQVLNMDDTNCQWQHDPPFLLTKTAGEVAAFFNRIARLDQIDKSTANVNSAIREIEQDVKHKEKDLEADQEKLKQFEPLERLEAEVEVLEELEKDYDVTLRSLSKLNSLLLSFRTINEEIKDASKITSLEKPVNDLLQLIVDRDQLQAEAKKIDKLITSEYDLGVYIKEYEKVLPAGALIDELIVQVRERDAVQTELSQLSRLTIRATNNGNAIKDAEFVLKQTHKEFEIAFPAGSICPLCNQEVKK